MICFRERLVMARNRKKLTQAALAEKMGIKSGKQSIYKWERGESEPSLSQLMKLAEVLETTVCWLVEEIGVEERIQVITQPPPGYVLLPADEVITMQRQIIQLRKEGE